jgi:NADPH:quinone reductase
VPLITVDARGVPGEGVTLSGRMRAAVITRFGPPEALPVRAVPVPVPAAGQVLVEVHAAGINPVDAQNRADGSWAGITLPAVLGSDAAGTIAALGPGVTGFGIGEPVFYFSDFLGGEGGSYAEYQAVDARIIARRPATLSHVEAAAVPLAAGTAYEVVVRRLAISTGEWLVICGASGGVGTYAVQLAKHAGARVIAVASAANHELVRSLGADIAIDYHDVDLGAAIRNAVGPVDAVADLVGAETAVRSLDWLGVGGRLASVACLMGDFDAAIDRNLTIHGVLVRPDAARLRTLAALIEAGNLRPVVTREYPLEQVAAAHRELERRHTSGKLVLAIG